jgi:heparin binding hemagglutinin HbhA
MSVTKTITTSKPFYVVAGAGDLAVKSFREGTDKLSALRIERKDIETTFASLQTETKALPAKAQTVAVTLAADVAGKVGTGYDELLGRGRSVVTRIRTQKSTQELQRQASTTIRRSKALVTTAKGAATDTKTSAKGTATVAKKSAASTRTSAKGTATVAKKRAATTKKAAKSTTTAARKTTTSARKATAAGAAKVGN